MTDWIQVKNSFNGENVDCRRIDIAITPWYVYVVLNETGVV